MFSWENNHRSKGQFASHLIKGTHYLHGPSLLTLHLITWLKECLLSFFTVIFLHFPSSFTVELNPFPVSLPHTLGGKPLYAAHAYGVGRYAASFWRQECFHKLFGILGRRLPLLLIYLLNGFIISIELIDISFICWVTIQYYFIHFAAPIVPAVAIGSSFWWVLCPFDIYSSLWDLKKKRGIPSFLALEFPDSH